MSDPNGYQPQGGDQQNNGVSGAAQAPQYTQPAQNYAAPQYTQSQGGYNGQYQDPNAYAQQNYTYAQPPAASASLTTVTGRPHASENTSVTSTPIHD